MLKITRRCSTGGIMNSSKMKGSDVGFWAEAAIESEFFNVKHRLEQSSRYNKQAHKQHQASDTWNLKIQQYPHESSLKDIWPTDSAFKWISIFSSREKLWFQLILHCSCFDQDHGCVLRRHASKNSISNIGALMSWLISTTLSQWNAFYFTVSEWKQALHQSSFEIDASIFLLAAWTRFDPTMKDSPCVWDLFIQYLGGLYSFPDFSETALRQSNICKSIWRQISFSMMLAHRFSFLSWNLARTNAKVGHNPGWLDWPLRGASSNCSITKW